MVKRPADPRKRPAHPSAAHANRGHAGHLAALARWVEEDPDGTTRTDYKRWRENYNGRSRPPGQSPAAAWVQVIRTFPELTVEDLRAAARGEVADPVALGKQRAEERLRVERNVLGLAGVATFAALIRESVTAVASSRPAARPGFPVVVLTLGGDVAYYAQDIVDYRDGEGAPRREEQELAGKVLGTAELATKLGRAPATIRNAGRLGQWHRVPQPDGSFAQQHYWLGETLERWRAVPPAGARETRVR